MRGAVFLAKEWLPFHEGLHVSNMPMKPQALAEYCTRHYGDDRRAQERVIRIPDEMLAAWRKPIVKQKCSMTGEVTLLNTDGPWDVFGPGKLWPLSGTHIAIDEAHLYIPSAENLEKRRMWRDWLRELGHHGATVEFITQNLEGLDKQVDKISEIRYTIEARASDKDPYLKIPMADWYEVKGKFTGEWRPWVRQREKRRIDKGWQNLDSKQAELRPEFFALYESYSRPQTEEGEGDSDEAVHVVEHEFQRRSWPSLLVWFARRNVDRLLYAFAFLCGFTWLTCFGGIPLLLGWFLAFIDSFVRGGQGKAFAEKNEVAAVSAPAIAGVQAEEAPGEVEAQGDGFLVPPETVIWSGPEGDYTVAHVQELMGDRQFLETQTQVQAEELAVLRREAGEVILLTPTHATFSSGERVAVGDPILRSGNDGQTLTAISYQNRQCLLSDGSVLSLRMSERRQQPGGLLAGLSGGVGGQRRDQGDASRGGRDGNVGDHGGGRYPNGRNDAGVVGRDGGEYDLGTGVGRPSGESGSPGRSSGSGLGAYSASSGRGPESGRQPILSGPIDAGGPGGDGGAGGPVGP